MADTIHKLTADLAAGDSTAVETFYRRYFDTLYSQARRATGRDESFCLDVVQESVLRVLRSVRPVQFESQFTAWLKLVVQTTAYDLLRAESRRRKREIAMVTAGVSSSSDADADGNDDDRLQWLRSKIAAMDEEIVRMIEMRFEKRWTLVRIARAFSLTIGTIDGRLRRALAELRRRAMEEFDE